MTFSLLADVLALDSYEAFCIHHLGFKPYPEQIDISNAYDNNSHLLVLMARQSGKSFTIASKSLYEMLIRNDKRILLCAPKKAQGVDIIYKHIRNWVSRSSFLMSRVLVGKNGQRQLLADYVEFDTGCSFRVLGADARANIVGYTGDIIILDEAQSITNLVVNRTIEPMLGHVKDPKYIKIGTPRGKGHFYDSWRDGKNGRLWTVLEYDWTKCSGLNKHIVEGYRHNNPNFQSEYELKWSENLSSFFSQDELLSLLDDYDIDYYHKMFKEGRGSKLYREVFCGIDLGLVRDNTVVSFIANEGGLFRCVGLYIFDTGTPYFEQVADTVKLLGYYSPLCIYIDATDSSTQAIVESLSSKGYFVEGVTFTSKFKSTILYNNLKVSANAKLLRIPSLDDVEKQFYELEKSLTPYGFDRISHPSGGHDDIPDSIALALLGFREQIDALTGRTVLADEYTDYMSSRNIFGISSENEDEDFPKKIIRDNSYYGRGLTIIGVDNYERDNSEEERPDRPTE